MMESIQPRRIRILAAIVERGRGPVLIEQMSKRGLGYQLRFTGRGTASSEMMDILGLGSTEKDIVISMGTAEAVREVVRDFSENLGVSRYKGIMMLLSPEAVSRLLAVVLTMQTPEITERKDLVPMKNEHRHSLILVAVNQGYTDQVMQTARRAGATGGTAVHAKGTGTELAKKFFGVSIAAEKELVFILTKPEDRRAIMKAIVTHAGMQTPAKSIVFSMPVCDVAGLRVFDSEE